MKAISALRILVVHDDEIDRQAIKRYLAAARVNADVDELADQADVVQRAQQTAYDCLIIDRTSAGESAVDIITRLRKANVHTPVLVVADKDESLGDHLVEAGATDILPESDLSPARLSRRVLFVQQLVRAQRAAQEAADVQRGLLAAVVEQLPLGVRVIDAQNYRPLVSNAAANHILGELSDASPTLLSDITELVGPAIEAACAGQSTEAIALMNGTGKLKVSVSPVAGAHGKVFAVAVVLADVTREEVAREQAELAVTQREHVLAIVSHDLRGPLSAINIAVSALRETDLSDRGRYIDAIQHSVERANRLIGDLLTASQIQAGAFSVVPRPTALAALFAAVVREHELITQKENIRLVVEHDEACVTMLADRERLMQALANLIRNALRHARGTDAITVGARPLANGTELFVRDDGPGVAPEVAPQIFDLFWQGKARAHGAGLGLAIVRGIARAHGGEATLAAGAGPGAEFRIFIPHAGA